MCFTGEPENIRVACIGAGSSGAGQMLLMEQFMPGSCVAFCDPDRRLFDKIMDGYLAHGGTHVRSFIPDLTALGERLRNLPHYKDPDEMLDREDINTVIIATYCSAHAEMVEKCAARGVNILLEKPIAVTEQDVERVWRLLRDYRKVSVVNFTLRGAPVSIAARKHVQNGDIGDIVSVQFINNVHYGDGYFRNWMRTRDKIGSLMLQKATHDFDLINSVIGLKPISVAAFGSRLVYGGDKPNNLTCDACGEKWECAMSIYRRHLDAAKPFPPGHIRKCVYAREIDIDDNQTIIFRYEGGVNVSYSQSFNAPPQGGQRGGYFIGTKGIMEFKYYNDFIETPSGEIITGTSSIDITRLDAKPQSRIHEVYDWAGRAHFDGTEYTMLSKLDLLNGHTSEVAGTIEQGYISAKMCLAAQESIETRQVIDLNLALSGAERPPAALRY